MHLISRKSPPDSPRESCRIRSPDTIVWIPRHIVQLRTGENCCALHAMRTVAPLHPHRNFFHRPLLGFLVCSPWRRIEMLAYLQEFGLGTPRCYDVLYHFSWSGLEAMFFSFCERFQRKRCWIKLMSFMSRLFRRPSWENWGVPPLDWGSAGKWSVCLLV